MTQDPYASAQYYGPFGPPPPPRRRGGALVAGAAVTALVVGGAAGFGGARLADRTTAEPAPATSTSAAPSPTGPTSTAPSPAAPVQPNPVDVARAVVPSTVMIRAAGGANGSIGSGFVLDTAGHMMTNNHVIAGAADGGRITVVFADGRRSAATIVGRSPSYDVAVVKVRRTGGLKPLPVGRSASVRVGQDVLAVGAPLGLPGTVTRGIVSATDRPVVVNANAGADAPSAYINGIQTDAPINPGNSGGPLVDFGGRVIGVNSAVLTLGQSRAQSGNIGLGFAIPIEQATQIGRQLIRDGKATYPVIGANLGDDDDGVKLVGVEDGGPADRAGLRVDDVVTKIDGQAVDTLEELIVAVRTHRPGEQVTLTYSRGRDDGRARVTLGSKEG